MLKMQERLGAELFLMLLMKMLLKDFIKALRN
jgi:hypothetical protein